MSNYNYGYDEYEDYDYVDPDLSKHKKSDKIKWIVTAVAFLLVFVLIGSLFAILLRSNKGEDKPAEPTVKVQTHVLAFDDVENRTSFSELKQVWEDNGITFTNLKGSGSNVGDYYNPVRLYAHSTLSVECEDMTRIVFYCVGATHVGNLRDSLDENALTVSVNNNDVTLEFDDPVDVFEVTDIIGQIQLSQIAVTAPFPVSSEDDTPDEENDVLEQDSGMLVSPESASEASPVGLAVRMLTAEEYGDYGIMPLAESAYTVTATVKDTTGGTPDAIQDVTWSMAWVSTNSAKVTDYVTMQTDGMTATFACLKAFTTKITVTCTAVLDTSKSATLTLDYAKRLSGGTAKFLTSGTSTAISMTSKTINVTFPSSYATGANTPLTGGDWSTDKSLQWFESGTYDSAGTTDNSVSYYVVTITPSEAFKSAYSNYKQSSANSMLSSFTMDSHGGTGYNMAATVNYFYMKLIGLTNGNDGTLSSAGIYRAMSLALFETTNQFTVSVAVTPQYGDVQTYTYVLNVSVAGPNISSVDLTHSSLVL